MVRDDTSIALADIRNERCRQMQSEGWTPEHDDTHSDGEMARAASCYAMTGSAKWLCDRARRERRGNMRAPADWPWSIGWWKPKDTRSDLVRAAALLVAEIERIDRAARKAA